MGCGGVVWRSGLALVGVAATLYVRTAVTSRGAGQGPQWGGGYRMEGREGART